MKISETVFSEKDIKATIRYLKTKNPLKATREDAIKLLEGMGNSAHILAHDIVEKQKKKPSN